MVAGGGEEEEDGAEDGDAECGGQLLGGFHDAGGGPDLFRADAGEDEQLAEVCAGATQARILAAARHEFGERGFEAATVRDVAKRAGVDPSLVLQHYGSKAALFTASIQLPAGEPDEAVGHLVDVLGLRALALPPEMRALVRSVLTAPEASAANLAASIGGQDAELRAAIAVSSILGLTVARRFLGLRSISDASADDLVRVAGDVLAANLTGRAAGKRTTKALRPAERTRRPGLSRDSPYSAPAPRRYAWSAGVCGVPPVRPA